MLEICADSLGSAAAAAAGGADRLELCANLPEGGTTPSAGLIRTARSVFPGRLMILIRPRGYDFLYAEPEMDAMLHDIRGLRDERPALYAPDSYAAGQALGRHLREQGSDGIVYQSVRDADGECAAVFRPRLLANCRQERHLCYVWDGRAIVTVYEKKTFT